jgi:hypothetical protein
MFIDGKVVFWVLAVFFGLSMLTGAVAGGIVGGQRGQPGVGLCCGIFGGIFGGFFGVLIGTVIDAVSFTGGVLSAAGQLILVGGIVIGATLCAAIFAKAMTSK